jgi:hypothetical protein
MRALLVTGAQRSGTTLIEKLLGAQPNISVLSQPFPLLFTEAKSRFLGGNVRYPLGHLFLESRYERDAFAEFLGRWSVTREELESLFARMRSYSGQYTHFTPEQLNEAFSRIPAGADFAEVVDHLDRSLAADPAAAWVGSKETICEEFVPPLLARGFRCAIILRDPRDIVTSLNHGNGRDFGGELKPTLFNVRNWRKSVAVALAMEGHPRFHWCRYEDLVVNPAEKLGRLMNALGLGAVDVSCLTGEIIDAVGQVWRGNSSHREHRSTGTGSLGTHHHVLPHEVAEYIEAASLPELQLLGYYTTLTRAAATRVLAAFREPYVITRTGMEGDAITPANAAVEAERLERVTSGTDSESSSWFLFPQVHTRLRQAFSS